MNSIHCGWGENLLNALGRNYCVSLAGEERGKELVAFWGLERREELLLLGGMNVDKNFFVCVCGTAAVWTYCQSLPRCCHLLRQTNRQHAHPRNTKQFEWICQRGVKTLSLPRQATDDDETARGAAATTTTTMMITDSSDDWRTDRQTKQHIYIYISLSESDDSDSHWKQKFCQKLISYWKYSPKICANFVEK